MDIELMASAATLSPVCKAAPPPPRSNELFPVFLKPTLAAPAGQIKKAMQVGIFRLARRPNEEAWPAWTVHQWRAEKSVGEPWDWVTSSSGGAEDQPLEVMSLSFF